MPARYVIDKQRRLVIATCSGRLTYTEITSVQDQWLRDPDFDPKFNLLADNAAVTSLDVSPEQAKAIAARRVFQYPARCAFVSTNPLIFGMTRLAEAHSQMTEGRAEWHVFRTREEALQWIGLPENYSSPERPSANPI